MAASARSYVNAAAAPDAMSSCAPSSASCVAPKNLSRVAPGFTPSARQNAVCATSHSCDSSATGPVAAGGNAKAAMPSGCADDASTSSRTMPSTEAVRGPAERTANSENSASRRAGSMPCATDTKSSRPPSTSSSDASSSVFTVASSATVNAGSMPSSSACARKIREHMP